MTEIYVGTISELAEEGSRKLIQAGDTGIGVFRRNGKYVAYINICQHQGGPICEGVMIGKVEPILTDDKRVLGETFSEDVMHISCPWHGYEYNLDSGVCIGDKRFKLKSYQVNERGNEVYVLL